MGESAAPRLVHSDQAPRAGPRVSSRLTHPRAMLRTVSLLVLLVASGCTSSTRLVSRGDASAVAQVDARLRGERASILLVAGDRHRGRVRFVRRDSTAWDEPNAVRVVETSSVSSIVTDTRGRSVRNGVLIGAGIGLAIGVAIAASPGPGPPDDFGEAIGNALAESGKVVVAVAAPFGGAFYGLIGGAVVGKRVEYVFVKGEPDGPPGRSE